MSKKKNKVISGSPEKIKLLEKIDQNFRISQHYCKQIEKRYKKPYTIPEKPVQKRRTEAIMHYMPVVTEHFKDKYTQDTIQDIFVRFCCLFDLTPLLERKCYACLNDPVFLSSVSVQNGCVTWPDDIDIDPEWLYEDSIPAASSTWADVARAYFKHHRVIRYRLKAVSDMTDDEVVQNCHWWQEEHHMVDDYWAFVKEHFPELA